MHCITIERVYIMSTLLKQALSQKYLIPPERTAGKNVSFDFSVTTILLAFRRAVVIE